MLGVDHWRGVVEHAIVLLTQVEDGIRVVSVGSVDRNLLPKLEIPPRDHPYRFPADYFVELVALVQTPSPATLAAVAEIEIVAIADDVVVPPS